MRSELVKVLHPLGGRPMLEHVIDSLHLAGVPRIVVVVGHQAGEVQDEIEADVEYVVQEQQLGTAHAVLQAKEHFAGYDGPLIVTYGDTPLYRPETYRRLIQSHLESGAQATVLSTFLDDPTGYGRVVREKEEGPFREIVEEKDISSEAIRAIREINTGTYCFDARRLFEVLGDVSNANRQGEYYLPDVLPLIGRRGGRVAVEVLADATEALGINDRRQLAEAEAVLRRRVLDRLMESGVTIVDPQSTHIHATVRIGRDTTIHPFTVIEGETTIGSGCEIGPHTQIRDATIGDGAVIDTAVIIGSTIGERAAVGPYTHLRPGSHVADDQRVGFAQIGKD